MIKAAIIDDGVNQPLRRSFTIEDRSVRPYIERHPPFPSHGDICYGIINKYFCGGPAQVQWYNLKALSPFTGTGSVESFLTALRLCTLFDVKLIHLSVGSSHREDFPEIERLIRGHTKRGVIVIAATNNRGEVTAPACLPRVIGVRHDDALRGEEFRYCPNARDGVDFAASSQHVLNGRTTQAANSFAAPLITSYALEYLCRHPKAQFPQVLGHLVSLSQSNFQERQATTYAKYHADRCL